MPNAERDVLRPIGAFLPDWSSRRIAENARAGRIPGARKIGRTWMMTRSAFERWTGTVVREVAPTIEDAAAELRRMGVC